MGDYEIKPEINDLVPDAGADEKEKEDNFESSGNPTWNERIWGYDDDEDRKFYEK
jgi:hypothetical protein